MLVCLKIEIALRYLDKLKHFFYQPKYHFDLPLILCKPFVTSFSFVGNLCEVFFEMTVP